MLESLLRTEHLQWLGTEFILECGQLIGELGIHVVRRSRTTLRRAALSSRRLLLSLALALSAFAATTLAGFALGVPIRAATARGVTGRRGL